MKKLLFLAIVLLSLTGCVTPQKPPSMPLYDRSAHVILADDHVIKRLYVPEGFSLVDRENLPAVMVFHFLGQDKNILSLGYSKNKPITVDFLETDGYEAEQLKGGKVYHKFFRGLYSDLVLSVPDGAEACAKGVLLMMRGTKPDASFAGSYMKSWSCDSIDDFGEYQQNKLKNEAYELLELK